MKGSSESTSSYWSGCPIFLPRGEKRLRWTVSTTGGSCIVNCFSALTYFLHLRATSTAMQERIISRLTSRTCIYPHLWDDQRRQISLGLPLANYTWRYRDSGPIYDRKCRYYGHSHGMSPETATFLRTICVPKSSQLVWCPFSWEEIRSIYWENW